MLFVVKIFKKEPAFFLTSPPPPGCDVSRVMRTASHQQGDRRMQGWCRSRGPRGVCVCVCVCRGQTVRYLSTAFKEQISVWSALLRMRTDDCVVHVAWRLIKRPMTILSFACWDSCLGLTFQPVVLDKHTTVVCCSRLTCS